MSQSLLQNICLISVQKITEDFQKGIKNFSQSDEFPCFKQVSDFFI